MKVFSMLKNKKGFTLVELTVIIVIIGILSTISAVGYLGWRQSVNETKLKNELTMAASALNNYRNFNNTYPASQTVFNGVYTASSGVVIKYVSLNNSTSYQLSAGLSDIKYTAIENAAPKKVSVVCPTGFIVVPGDSQYGTSDFCVMKYEAQDGGSNKPVSVALGTPWFNITRANAAAYSANSCSGCRLISEAQRSTIAANVYTVDSNWSGGRFGQGAIYVGNTNDSPIALLNPGNDDNNGYYGSKSDDLTQRRTLTLSNGEVIWDFAGNVWEMSLETSTLQAGYSADPYCKEYNNSGIDYGRVLSQSVPPASVTNSLVTPSARGLGMFCTDYDAASGSWLYARGGGYGSGATAPGIFSVKTNNADGFINEDLGFRVAR